MKSAEEWAKDWHGGYFYAHQAAAIQRDALEAAAQACEKLTKDWRPGPMDGHFDIAPHQTEYPACIRSLIPKEKP